MKVLIRKVFNGYIVCRECDKNYDQEVFVFSREAQDAEDRAIEMAKKLLKEKEYVPNF